MSPDAQQKPNLISRARQTECLQVLYVEVKKKNLATGELKTGA